MRIRQASKTAPIPPAVRISISEAVRQTATEREQPS